MHILVGQQHRARRSEPLQFIEQRLQRQLLLALWGEIKGWVVIVRRQAEQGRDQRQGQLQPVQERFRGKRRRKAGVLPENHAPTNATSYFLGLIVGEVII